MDPNFNQRCVHSIDRPKFALLFEIINTCHSHSSPEQFQKKQALQAFGKHLYPGLRGDQPEKGAPSGSWQLLALARNFSPLDGRICIHVSRSLYL
jgi:hypothetical protein